MIIKREEKVILKPKRPVVILCGGRGRRLLDISESMPKAMAKINDRPIISYVIDYWLSFANKLIFVVGYKKEQIIEYVEEQGLDIEIKFVDQKKPAGIAHAVSRTEKIMSSDFIVVLGDCLCKGNFVFPKKINQGVGIWETNNVNYIKQSLEKGNSQDRTRPRSNE